MPCAQACAPLPSLSIRLESARLNALATQPSKRRLADVPGETETRSTGRPYASGVLSDLRNPDGGPSLRVRFLALLVVVGLVALTAPLLVVPAVRALLDALL